MPAIYVVDAFATDAFGGNPAAVVPLDAPADEAWMRNVAAEMKHSETAFVVRRADGSFDLRWFTPEVEVDLCGHATLATAHVLFETGRVDTGRDAVFHTRSGELRAARDADGIRLDFPLVRPAPAPPIDGLLAALGLPTGAVQRAGDFFVLVEVADTATVTALAPDFAALRAVDAVRATIVTAAGSAPYDFVSRVFGPRVGIDEDPVTGAAHCVLAAFWGDRLGKDDMVARQVSRRGGDLVVRRRGERVHLVGRAVTVVRGELVV